MRTNRRTAAIAVASLALSLLPATAAHAQEPVDYAALGDSYSSGTGTGSYTDSGCQRSDLAYPSLIAADHGLNLDFAACSGATTDDLLADQLDGLDEGTDLVSVTIGGNDIGWVDAVISCMAPTHDCTGDIEEAERKATEELPGRLAAVYGEIDSRAPGADVYVLGYPRLFGAHDTCDAFGLISIAEQERMNQGADLLSGVIESAAASAGFTYVDVRDRFDDHAVCDTPEWINGLTFPIGESYHPNAAGHSGGYYPALADRL
ncbi:SGNH/GDSL hydrolase family protein [Glycomyces xiaoerkulensis]|uniref:SGNH/GDSL hydrolase family protein n=1 Tax=Glycomyces xiaoerkulensis TaxID=2038139 RepID=UPI000C256006|nr:SGNH/GDSL hydrolase family protein [Glycomyces xiaoerkulensis]